MRKILALCLAAALALTLLAGCAGAPAGDGTTAGTTKAPAATTAATTAASKATTPAATTTTTAAPESNLNELGTYPIVKESVSLTCMGASYPGHSAWGELKIFKILQDLTNIQVEFITHDGSIYQEKLNLALTSGDYPDFFLAGSLTTKTVDTYGPQGVFIPLEDLLENDSIYAKKFLLVDYPEAYNACKGLDGRLYTLPNVTETATSAGYKMWYYKPYLQAAGLDKPKTIEDFYEMLTAIRDGDGNGNGKPDEIPVGYYGGIDVINGWLQPAFGLVSNGAMVGLTPEGGIVFNPYEANYKEYLQYMHTLYAENLLEHESYTQDRDQYLAKSKELRYGVLTVGANLSMPNEEWLNVEILTPLTSQYNPNPTSPGYNKVNNTCFAITSANEYPQETMRWIDIFYRYPDTESINGFSGDSIWLGIEGDEWIYTNPEKTEYKFIMDLGSLTLVEYLHKYICLGWGIGNMVFMASPARDPADTSVASLYNAEVARETIEEYVPYAKPVYPSTVRYTAEELERLSILETDLDKYYKTMEAKFITGEESFDRWEDYVSTVKKMGGDDYLKIKTDAYNRFIG